MVHAQTLDLVQWYQYPGQECLVLLLQRKGEAVDDGAENLEEFGNSIETLRLVGELEEDVVDGAADKGPQVEKLAIDAMEGRLEEIPLPGILRVEQLEQREDEAVVDVRLGDVGVEVLALDEAQEELVHDLDMRPGHLQHGLVFLRIESLALGIHGWRDGSEQILGEHLDDAGVHGLRDDLPVVSDVVEELVQGESLDLFRLHVAASIVEIEDDIALVNLLHEQVLASVGRDFVETRQLLQLAVGGDVEARRVLTLRRPQAFGYVLGGLVQSIEHERLGAGLGGRQVMGHGLRGTRGRDVLERKKEKGGHVSDRKLSSIPEEETGGRNVCLVLQL